VGKFVVWSLLTTLLSAPGVAQAQHSGTPEEQKACGGDARRHCRAVLDQGDFAVLKCLQQHQARLSRSCKAVLQRNGQ
jgi:hypothetical protein